MRVIPQALLLLMVLFAFAQAGSGKCVAVLSPDRSLPSVGLARLLADHLTDTGAIDTDMATAAFMAAAPQDAYNMKVTEGRRAGAAIGCGFFVLVKSQLVRRNSSSRPEYYEAYAAVYTVSSRTGRLVDWRFEKHESDLPSTAVSRLHSQLATVATHLKTVFRTVAGRESVEKDPPPMEEPPSDDSPLAKDFHPPLPYRRIKPEYTAEADLHSVEATVEIVVDIDDKGTILRTEIIRWAGYGLDESVEKTVRGMTWRPADRRRKSLPMRILLRYNFKKVAKN